MLPMKAYVVEAYYKWIVDSGCTPYLLVDTSIDYVDVPAEYIQHDQIVLNMAPESIRDLTFNTSYISFLTQFSGVTRLIYVPIIAVLSIYAKENGDGRVFEGLDEDHDHPLMQPMPLSHFEGGDGDGDGDGSSGSGGASHLRVVK